jgi:peptidoglycan/xylan/chitin deacetylase (PgdA/CDA1 family)
VIEGLSLLAWPRHKKVLSILIYHRVLPAFDPLRPGEVVAAIFERQMRFLSRHFSVLPLIEAVERLKRGKLPPRACCVSFDDGYADNLTVALPILERHRLPATVFVATGYLDGGRMFNDAVIDAIGRATGATLDLRELGLGQHPLATVEERRATVAAVLDQIKYRPPAEREASVQKLIKLADCGALPHDIMLTSAQVGELSLRGIEIGGHTVAHTILTTLDDQRARQELAQGKQQLESITGKPVRAFAYPNGRPQRDYAARHVAMAREVGFDLAVSTASGVANPGSDVFQLPRFTPWGTSVTMLGARMMRNAWTGEAAAEC